MHVKRKLIAALAAACSMPIHARAQEAPKVPVIPLKDETRVNAALLAGAFPHPFDLEKHSLPGKPERGGFDEDFLAAFGGEAFAKIDGETSIPFHFDDAEGVAKVVAIRGGQLLNFRGTLDPPGEYGVAYAVVDIEAAEAADATCFFGSDDYAKVWLNGEPVLEVWALDHPVWHSAGRAIEPGEDTFKVSFKPGLNRMVFKIEQKLGGWGMDAEIVTAAGMEARRLAKIEREKTDRFRFNDLFLYDEEKMETRGRLLPFIKGKLPGVVFQNPELAAEMADMDTFRVRWFDPGLNEVLDEEEDVTEPGLYCAYVEVRAKSGFMLRRVVPALLLADVEWWRDIGLFEKDRVDFTWHEGIYPSAPEAAWNARQNLLRDTLNMAVGHGWMFDGTPMFFAELSLDAAPAGAWRVSPYANLHNHFTRLRQKVLERPAPRELAPPAPDAAATALRVGAEAEAGFKPGAVEAIRAAAQEWAGASSNGFVLAVARRGVVVLREAFHGAQDAGRVDPGQLTDGKLTTLSRLPTASITKLHAGVLLGRLIDQGLVSLDDPVSKFFPDFAGGGEKDITVRRLMNHTSGLDGHRWFMAMEGMANPFLDNVAWWDMRRATPGARYNYNGFGIDLGGKVIEDVTGRPVFDVMRDGLFIPLGQDNPTVCDLGYGMDCTAMDLLRVAEMLRQEGAYGGKRYFSRETFRSLLPVPLVLEAEEVAEEYGVGISWMRDHLDTASTEDHILGANVFGHGSATGAILRVAPDLELVVGMARYTQGPDCWQHTSRLMKVIADHLAE